jgi:hypothetical protein
MNLIKVPFQFPLNDKKHSKYILKIKKKTIFGQEVLFMTEFFFYNDDLCTYIFSTSTLTNLTVFEFYFNQINPKTI